MKIKGQVTNVADRGDKLMVVGQGNAVGDADWRPPLAINIDMPLNDRNRKAFYVGRKFVVEVTPA